MDSTARDTLTQLDNLLAASNQSWLFGAGISVDAGIPLMWPLTERVLELARAEGKPDDIKVLNHIGSMLPDGWHIEHILSHIGDHRAIADRSRVKNVVFDGTTLSVNELASLHQRILAWIAATIRWGYKPGAPPIVGTKENPIVTINDHLDFVDALFNRNQAGVAERRRAVRLFTTNYDTLIEDALALGGFSYWDGFSGGAVAYRSHRYGEEEACQGDRALVVKLHGSIDWHLGADGRVWRVRDGDLYPDRVTRVLIYPQSTKYLATQRDPFAAQFDLFRRALSAQEENVLAMCGYSFGDEHINQEIELALSQPANKSTVIAFSKTLSATLNDWRIRPWGKRVYVVAEEGLYAGPDGPIAPPTAGVRDWWKFTGVTRILSNGAEACAL